MCTCKDCEFGHLVEFDSEPGTKYWYCLAVDDVMTYEEGMDNDLGCDLYVEKLDDYKTEEPSA